MWKHAPPTIPPVLVVIGAHRDELVFGQNVSAKLDRERFSVLRISQGISGERPRPDQLARFRERHRDLYLQILEHVKRGQRLLIDLHHGIDSGSLSADVLCADQNLLDRVCGTLHQPEQRVRCIRLVSNTALSELPADNDTLPLVAKPEIPETVWNHTEILYVGIEIYLSGEGPGTASEQAFARSLVEQVADCALG